MISQVRHPWAYFPAQAKYCGCRDCNFNLESTGPYQIVSNLSSEGFLELCSFDCRVAFMRKWIQSHLQECKRIGGTRLPPIAASSVLNMLEHL